MKRMILSVALAVGVLFGCAGWMGTGGWDWGVVDVHIVYATCLECGTQYDILQFEGGRDLVCPCGQKLWPCAKNITSRRFMSQLRCMSLAENKDLTSSTS